MPKLPQIEKVFSSSFDPTEVSSLAYLLEDAREFTGKPLPEGGAAFVLFNNAF